MRRFTYLIIWLLLPAWLSAQTSITQVEYWYDGDYGTVDQQTVSGTSVNFTDLLDVSSLESGLHTLTIRFQDTRGVWGSVLTKFFTYYPGSSPGVHLVTDAEYWYDGNYSTATEVPLSSGESADLNTLLDVSSLIEGLHTVSLRFKDNRGIWSAPIIRFFKKEDSTGLKQLVALQYWFDEDYAGRHDSTFSASTLLNLNKMLDISGLSVGIHSVNYRFQEEGGKWSPVRSWFFHNYQMQGSVEMHNITTLEYWYNGDYSSVQTEDISGVTEFNLDKTLDISSLGYGLHYVSYRFKDEAGEWSPAVSKLFSFDKEKETAQMHEITALQYWFDGDYSAATKNAVAASNIYNVDEDIDVSGLSYGLHFVSYRFQDEAGEWSSVVSKMFSYVQEPEVADMHKLISVEYWIDGDISGSEKSAIPAGSDYVLNTQLDVSALNDGLHYISYRFQDETGVWSSAHSELFSKYQDEIITTNNKITKYRYWADDQIGSAVEVTLSTPVKSFALDELVDVSSLPGGTHDITFQFKDLVGLWSGAYTESYSREFNPGGSITAETNPACTNSLTTFTSETVDVDSIYWDFGDGTEMIGLLATEDAYHVYSNAGDYMVTAILKETSSANSDTVYTSIIVNQSYGVSVVAPENLVAYYPLDGNANDASTFGHDGTVFGAIPTTDRNGNTGQAYYFDGVNDYIDIGDWENGGTISFTFWARWDAFNNYSRIVDLGNGSSSNNIIVANYQTGNNIFFSAYNNSSEIKYYTPALTLGQWDYFAATIDEFGEMKVYKNGVLIGNKTNAFVPYILTRTAQYIGKSNFSADGYFNGAIDELKIYNKALSAEEILLDFQGMGGEVLPPLEVDICSGEIPYSFGSQLLSHSGTYYETFHTVNGCDSVVQLNLTVHPIYSSLEMPDAANLVAYYPFNGNANDESGKNLNGVVNGATLTDDRNGNPNSAYLFDGNDGIYVPHTDELNMTGELSVSCWIKPTELQNAMIFGKSNYTTATNYLLRVQSDGNIQWEYDGYLNTTTSPLQANNWYHIVVTADNPGENRKVYVDGQLIAETASSSGPFGSVTNQLTFGYSSLNGERFKGAIDDIRFYDKELTESEIAALYQESGLIEEKEICSSETPYTFGKQQLIASGTYTETFRSIYGCDSIVTLNLTVNPSYDLTDEVTVCAGDLPYEFGTQSLTTAGEYTETFMSVNGCDSTVTLTLNVGSSYELTDQVTVCAGDLPYEFGTQSLTTAGEYTETFASVNGCDSTVTLTLNVGSSYELTDEITVCDSDLPYKFGTQSLTTAGEYTETFMSVNGCDSVVTLTLNVNPTYEVTDEITVCESELPYKFGSHSLLAAGEYTETFTSVNGCDSIVTLTLNVNPSYYVEESVKIWEDELPYMFGSRSLVKEGVYSEIFTTVEGCDSTVVLTLHISGNMPPDIICHMYTVNLDNDGQYVLTDEDINHIVEGTTDDRTAYNDLIINVEPNHFDCSDLGEVFVQITVVDEEGNSSSCATTITVLDDILPEFLNVPDVLVEAEPGLCYAMIEYPEIIASDNCSGYQLTQIEGLGPNGQFPVGSTTERWMAEDVSGNTQKLNFDVIVTPNPVNPSVDQVDDVFVLEDDQNIQISLTGIDDGDGCKIDPLNFELIYAENYLIQSWSVDYLEGDVTGTLNLDLIPDANGDEDIILKVVNDTENTDGAVLFNLDVIPQNDAPVIVNHIDDVTITTQDSVVLVFGDTEGIYFDDIDLDDQLSYQVKMVDGSDIPEWLIFSNDSLIMGGSTENACYELAVTAFDLAGAQISDTFSLCIDFPVGIDAYTLDNQSVILYPNPTDGLVNLEFNGIVPEEIEIIVYNMNSDVIMREEYRYSNIISIDLSNQPSGAYLIKAILDKIESNHVVILKD